MFVVVEFIPGDEYNITVSEEGYPTEEAAEEGIKVQALDHITTSAVNGVPWEYKDLAIFVVDTGLLVIDYTIHEVSIKEEAMRGVSGKVLRRATKATEPEVICELIRMDDPGGGYSVFEDGHCVAWFASVDDASGWFNWLTGGQRRAAKVARARK